MTHLLLFCNLRPTATFHPRSHSRIRALSGCLGFMLYGSSLQGASPFFQTTNDFPGQIPGTGDNADPGNNYIYGSGVFICLISSFYVTYNWKKVGY